MKIQIDKSKFCFFGNKGNVWNKQAHISQLNDGTYRTLCGTPMLSTNWVQIEGITIPGCKECIRIYQEKCMPKLFLQNLDLDALAEEKILKIDVGTFTELLAEEFPQLSLVQRSEIAKEFVESLY